MTADEPALSQKERALGELRTDIEATREKLAATLDAIEDKLNVPKQAHRLLGRIQLGVERVRRDNPAVLYAAAGAVVAVAGGVVAWRLSRR